MRLTQVNRVEEASLLLVKLNHCHDGSLVRIAFTKPRDVNKENGSLTYPFTSMEDDVLCDVEAELILNSYEGAKTDQRVVFEFKGVTSFRFEQGQYDYSDIYEAKCQLGQEVRTPLMFTFYATKEKHITVILQCKEWCCKEL